MAFIVQCPHPNCRKYMLLEDHVRGIQVKCLACGQPIQLDPSGSSDRAKPPPLKSGASRTSARAKRQAITNCPSCNTPLRLPPSHQGKSIKCPVCKHVFTA